MASDFLVVKLLPDQTVPDETFPVIKKRLWRLFGDLKRPLALSDFAVASRATDAFEDGPFHRGHRGHDESVEFVAHEGLTSEALRSHEDDFGLVEVGLGVERLRDVLTSLKNTF